MPEYNALLGLSTVATMNLFSVIILGELAFKNDLVPNPRVAALLIWSGFAVLHYVILLPASAARVAEPSAGGSTKIWTVLFYAIASFVVFFALVILKMANVSHA